MVIFLILCRDGLVPRPVQKTGQDRAAADRNHSGGISIDFEALDRLCAKTIANML